jgi:hypothetical protein
LYILQRWLVLVLDLLCAVVAFIVVTLAVELKARAGDKAAVGYTGIALVNISTLALNMADFVDM